MRTGRAVRGGVALAITTALSAVWLAPAAMADDPAVVFEDSDLAACVADALELPVPSQITASKLAGLKDLTCTDDVIGSLHGLEGATALESLDLHGSLYRAEGYPTFAEQLAATNHMLDPLAGLGALQYLDIGGSYYGYDIGLEPLASMPSLSFLILSDVKGHDLTPVAAATGLQVLVVEDAWPIGDVSPLAEMPNLVYLDMTDLAAGDLTPLTTIPNLAFLALEYAHATVLPSFVGHTAITAVDLFESSVKTLGGFAGTPLAFADISNTGVTSLSAFAGATDLTELYADNSKAVDLTPLANATKLERFSLLNGKVSSVAPLAGAQSLSYLELDRNAIVDVSPLGSLPALEQWSVMYQASTIPAFDACAPTPFTVPIDRDGTPLAVTASNGVVVNGNAISPASSGVTYSATSSKDSFSVVQTAKVNGVLSVCNWPSGYLPTVTMPTELTADTESAVGFTGGVPGIQAFSKVTWTSDYFSFDGPTRTFGEGYLGVPTTVTSTFSAKGMQTVTQSSGPLLVQGGFTLTFDYVNPVIAGYDAVVPTFDVPSGATATCSWKLSGVVVASGTSCEYYVPTSAAGKSLETTVTVTKPNYRTLVYTLAARPVLRSFGDVHSPAEIPETSVSLFTDVGKTLHASKPTYAAAPSSFTYQWTRNGDPIPGATGATYVVAKADAGQSLNVDVTAQRTGYFPSTTPALVSMKVRKLFSAAPTPTITGSLVTGGTLTANAAGWSPKPSSLSYQWYRNGTAISGATKSTYKTATTDGGATITAKVTAKRSGYTTSSKTSPGVKVLKRLTSAPAPTISGTAVVKSTLTAHAGTWAPGTVTKRYQWYRDGTAISGATGPTYKPGVKDAFARFTVKVTGTKSGYASASRTSKETIASGIKYASCAALLADYPGGVAKSASVPGLLDTAFVSAKLFALNSARDTDGDGWVCEP